jgi:hypothetical protein
MNRWSCLPTSFALVLKVPVQSIIDWIGHDGSEILWPDLPEPLKRRGFHIQELIDFCWMLKIAVTQFQAIPCSGSKYSHESYQVPQKEGRISLALKNQAVITGETLQGMPHAIGWDGHIVLDPGKKIVSIDEFLIETVWVISKIKSREKFS